MTAKIFRNSMIVGISVFLLSAALFLWVFYQHFENQMLHEMENEMSFVTQGVEAAGMDYLEALDTSCRITWVAPDGAVLFDNVADAGIMENHADREEIREAGMDAHGVAVRQSVTVSEKTFYVARQLQDGSVIRLANTQRTIFVLLASMTQPLLLILMIALVLAVTLAHRLSRRLIQPILELDLEHPETCRTYDELAPLLTRIRHQNETIQKQMDLLRQRQQEFSALTENMSEGFLLLDRKGRVLSHNTGALQLLGAAAPAEEADVFVLSRDEDFRRVVEQALEGCRSYGHLEREGRSIQLLADPVLREERVAGAVLVLLDVTEREQSEKLRREFTANVSHELKTPLTSISGMAEIIANGLVRPEDVNGFAGDIYKESRRLIALVEDIIHLSRLDEGQNGVERENVDLLELARDVERRLGDFAAKNGVSLAVEGEPFVVSGVPSVLDEMLYNLCDNAIKYNRPGGRVTVTVEPGDRGGWITVADTGIGIPPQDQERVFERFYRVDKSHSRAIGGTGLGLSIVKHGAALHDIRVELESVLEQGTTVRLVFPE